MSAAINTGGPAFPVEFDHHTFQPRTVEEAKRLMSGMTLRDWFAGKAMAAHAVAVSNVATDSPEDWHAMVAQMAYRTADAMLAARQGGAA